MQRCNPVHPLAGLTEAEKEEGQKAAEAAKEEGGSDDDDGDYRKASKVRLPACLTACLPACLPACWCLLSVCVSLQQQTSLQAAAL
jgi:hypothetical protein